MSSQLNYISLHRPERGIYETWGALTDICKAHNFPYNTLKDVKFPFKYDGWNFVKTKYKTLGEPCVWTNEKKLKL